MSMKSVFLDYGTMGSADLDLSPLEKVLPELQVFDKTELDQRVDRIQGADVVLTNKARLDRDVLKLADSVKYIGLAATGTDNIDLEYCLERRIAVCNLVAYCTQSVTEHVFAVLLNLTHSIGRFHSLVRAGEWQRSDNFCRLDFPIRELSAMTLGIVGHGELGRSVERVALQFGMKVIIARRRGQAAEEGDGRHDLETVLRESDALTLHCPLTDETRHLINAQSLSLMKASAILINTARGGLVDSAALVAALNNRTIAAAGIDVLAQEPPVEGDPLIDYSGDNLIITPHIAWATREARQNAIVELAKNYTAFVAGESRNRVI